LERLLEHLVATIGDGAVDGGIPADAIDVFEDEAVFAWMRLFSGKIRDGGHEGGASMKT
jgi:hypothetical protein